jgi:hypothetical protein
MVLHEGDAMPLDFEGIILILKPNVENHGNLSSPPLTPPFVLLISGSTSFSTQCDKSDTLSFSFSLYRFVRFVSVFLNYNIYLFIFDFCKQRSTKQ